MIRALTPDDVDDVETLASIARSEGFCFLDRLLADLRAPACELTAPGQFYLCVVNEDAVVGVGGVTPDPYLDNPAIGRVRHVYIHPTHRRSGYGRLLVREIEARARDTYSVLRLRTDTAAAARFYEALGYSAISDSTATHARSSD